MPLLRGRYPGRSDQMQTLRRDVKREETGREGGISNPSTILIIFLCVGPLVLPLIWLNPRFNQNTKIIISIIIVLLSYFLGSIMINSMRSIKEYYDMIGNNF